MSTTSSPLWVFYTSQREPQVNSNYPSDIFLRWHNPWLAVPHALFPMMLSIGTYMLTESRLLALLRHYCWESSEKAIRKLVLVILPIIVAVIVALMCTGWEGVEAFLTSLNVQYCYWRPQSCNANGDFFQRALAILWWGNSEAEMAWDIIHGLVMILWVTVWTYMSGIRRVFDQLETRFWVWFSLILLLFWQNVAVVMIWRDPSLPMFSYNWWFLLSGRVPVNAFSVGVLIYVIGNLIVLLGWYYECYRNVMDSRKDDAIGKLAKCKILWRFFVFPLSYSVLMAIAHWAYVFSAVIHTYIVWSVMLAGTIAAWDYYSTHPVHLAAEEETAQRVTEEFAQSSKAGVKR